MSITYLLFFKVRKKKLNLYNQFQMLIVFIIKLNYIVYSTGVFIVIAGFQILDYAIVPCANACNLSSCESMYCIDTFKYTRSYCLSFCYSISLTSEKGNLLHSKVCIYT